ncbi:MAG: hypothetical protein AAGJ81_15590 [Verrucomicrobiota bacterium]
MEIKKFIKHTLWFVFSLAVFVSWYDVLVIPEDHTDRLPWNSSSTSMSQTGNAYKAVSPEQYQTAVSEIAARVSHEFNLFLYQFLVIAGIVGAFIREYVFANDTSDHVTMENRMQGGVLGIVVGLALCFLLIISLHLRYNTIFIQQLGNWIYVFVENGPDSVFSNIGWESYINNFKDAGPQVRESRGSRVISDPFFGIFVSALNAPTCLLAMVYFYFTARVKSFRSQFTKRIFKGLFFANMVLLFGLFVFKNNLQSVFSLHGNLKFFVAVSAIFCMLVYISIDLFRLINKTSVDVPPMHQRS